ncbi:hypothetical protein ACOI1H_19725 [Loktanella sp. DJP18]|uniref:hypothetical protein n=1 Tax=Loktanella sp. DJP18 TaxID=3409788 RepID=UPI003BB7FCDB
MRALTGICLGISAMMTRDLGHAASPLSVAIAAAETQALALIAASPDIADSHRNIILQTFSPKLVATLSNSEPGHSHFSHEDWRTLLLFRTPADLALWISKDLGLGNQHHFVFRQLETQVSAPVAAEMASVLAHKIAAIPFKSRLKENGIWSCDAIERARTPLMADYLRVNVVSNPHEATDRLHNATSAETLPLFVAAHLAGLSLSNFCTKRRLARAVYQGVPCRHAKCTRPDGTSRGPRFTGGFPARSDREMRRTPRA